MNKVSRRTFLKTSGKALGGLMLGGILAGCSSEGDMPKQSRDLKTLSLMGPIAPLSIPLTVLIEQNRLKPTVRNTNFSVWNNPDQLRAKVVNSQAHFTAIPSNVAANFYNKGIRLKLLNVAIWGILYLVSSEKRLSGLNQLKGDEILIPFKGDMPDLVFRFLCRQKDLSPSRDFELRYASSPVEAAQLLATGHSSRAILPEPAATMAIMKAKKKGVRLRRGLDLQQLWGRVTGRAPEIPQAGIAALPSVLNNHGKVIPEFQDAYTETLNWVNANPAASGKVGERYISGLKAGPATESLKHTRMKAVPARDARSDLEFFYRALSELSADLIGGKLPADDFYYEGA